MHECDRRGCPTMPYGASQISHCTVCHETFASNWVGDHHQVGPFDPIGQRRCLTPDEMRAKGWEQNPLGRWGRGAKSSAALKGRLLARSGVEGGQTVNSEGTGEG